MLVHVRSAMAFVLGFVIMMLAISALPMITIRGDDRGVVRRDDAGQCYVYEKNPVKCPVAARSVCGGARSRTRV